MNVIERYILYIEQINEGTRPAPEGIVLTQTEPLAKAAELQGQNDALGGGTGPFVDLLNI